jgi:hypothetical protein
MNARGDDKIKTEFTRGEIKAAMKNVDDEGRDILVEAAKKGDIKVVSSKTEKLGSAISGTYRVGKTTIKAAIIAPIAAPFAASIGVYDDQSIAS